MDKLIIYHLVNTLYPDIEEQKEILRDIIATIEREERKLKAEKN